MKCSAVECSAVTTKPILSYEINAAESPWGISSVDENKGYIFPSYIGHEDFSQSSVYNAQTISLDSETGCCGQILIFSNGKTKNIPNSFIFLKIFWNQSEFLDLI